MNRALAHATTLLALLLSADAAIAARCLFVSSYHRGYAWSDGVERGLRSVLEGQCELRQFDMDTKRNKNEAHIRKAAEEARELIAEWRPDVVITADDNAAKFLIQPYFRDAKVPFVFAGVNWTADEYGFPYSNVTGIVEVAPIGPMLKTASEATDGGRRAFYLGADTLTERKNLARFEQAADDLDLLLESRLVPTADAWIEAYREAQDSSDFVVIGSYSGIVDWKQSESRIKAAVSASSRRLSVTNHGWMMPFTMLGMTKVPEEHGIWSGKTALAILAGAKPSDIPIIANRQWDVWVNDRLLTASKLELPVALRRKAKTSD